MGILLGLALSLGLPTAFSGVFWGFYLDFVREFRTANCLPREVCFGDFTRTLSQFRTADCQKAIVMISGVCLGCSHWLSPLGSDSELPEVVLFGTFTLVDSIGFGQRTTTGST